MGLIYRLRQLRNNITAGPLPTEARREIADILSIPEQELFSRFSAPDQWHSYRVLRTLKDAGYNQPDLLAAALLHDIGKIRCPLSVWDRAVIVIVQTLFPHRAEAWGRESVTTWRRPFVARALHPVWGAEMAAEIGSRPVVIELIRRHQDKLGEDTTAENDLLAVLQWADGQN